MRSKVPLLLLISFFFAGFAQSQSNELIIQGTTGKLFLTHTVHPKDNWYSIGRLYNISPKVIAPFNNLTLDKSLSIGEQVQIPLTAVNFSQDGQKTAETLVPVYHIIQDKEWMYRISVNHNKVPIANLEKWNNINGGQIKAGMQVIVGYLKVKTALSALASGDGGASMATVPPTPAAGETAVVPASAGSSETKAIVKTVKPATSGASTQGSSSTGAQGNTPVSAPVAATATPAGSQTTTQAGSQASVPTAAKETPAQTGSQMTAQTTNSQAAAPVNSSEAVAPAVKPAAEHHAALNFSGGYFKSDFSDGGKSISGVAGTFKSTSGWQDGKYYALMNNAMVGTIVKITLPATGKSVYAKILGQLPDMKESVGLTIRISNAAASELGGGDGKMSVEVGY